MPETKYSIRGGSKTICFAPFSMKKNRRLRICLKVDAFFMPKFRGEEHESAIAIKNISIKGQSTK